MGRTDWRLAELRALCEAAARAAVPELLDEVDRLRRLLEERTDTAARMTEECKRLKDENERLRREVVDRSSTVDEFEGGEGPEGGPSEP